MLASGASAQTVEQLKRELAAKRAEVAKLEQRIRKMESGSDKKKPLHPPARQLSSAPPPDEPDVLDRALERTFSDRYKPHSQIFKQHA